MEEKTNEFEEKEAEKQNKEEKFIYKDLFKEKNNTRVWSLASLLAAVLSVIFCFLPVLGIILSLFSVALSVISRRVLGYFDGLSIAGLIVGIFGFVFGIGYSILQAVLINTNLFG
ncbi:MAG: DUF4190 domain-containing protein [Clostridia bacterium]|nr:DUF4190 domain-containing protein [Clostridia bacterium]